MFYSFSSDMEALLEDMQSLKLEASALLTFPPPPPPPQGEKRPAPDPIELDIKRIKMEVYRASMRVTLVKPFYRQEECATEKGLLDLFRSLPQRRERPRIQRFAGTNPHTALMIKINNNRVSKNAYGSRANRLPRIRMKRPPNPLAHTHKYRIEPKTEARDQDSQGDGHEEKGKGKGNENQRPTYFLKL